MNTIMKEVKILDDKDEAIKWLEGEYPHGVDLVYVDYSDRFEDAEQLQKILKSGETWMEWIDESSFESIREIKENYRKEMGAEELSDEVLEIMSEWLGDHDTSNAFMELLKHTGSQLCYIETEDYAEHNVAIGTGCDPEDYKHLVKKYGKTEEQAAAVRYVLDNQFYGGGVSFYFYVDMEDLFKALWNSEKKYIQVSGAYFSTIDRGCGSNWMSEKAVFDLVIPREKFLENFYLDSAKGNGYSWDKIAGQTEYDDAVIVATNKGVKGAIRLHPITSEKQKREKMLEENWRKTGKCIMGDMNVNRHPAEKQEYINSYPCGTKCKECGTFWID